MQTGTVTPLQNNKLNYNAKAAKIAQKKKKSGKM
jgi:hypothetical protein